VKLETHSRFVLAYLIWCLGAATLLIALDVLSVINVYILLLVGILILLELMTPSQDSSRWFVRLQRLAILGVIGFILIVINHLLGGVL
jgi:hypothetical protein